MKLKNYKERVWSILEEHENARNNDLSLYAIYIWKYEKGKLADIDTENPKLPLKNFQQMPPLSSIKRARRIIQNDDNEFLPTDEDVRKARKIKQENYEESEVEEAKAQKQ